MRGEPRRHARFAAAAIAATRCSTTAATARTLEWDARNGVIVRLGAKHGIATPRQRYAGSYLLRGLDPKAWAAIFANAHEPEEERRDGGDAEAGNADREPLPTGAERCASTIRNLFAADLQREQSRDPGDAQHGARHTTPRRFGCSGMAR